MEGILEKDELEKLAEADRQRHIEAVGTSEKDNFNKELNTEKQKRRY